MPWHRRTWEIVELARPGDTPSRAFDVTILTLIFLNVLAVILGSVAAVRARFGLLLEYYCEHEAQPEVFSSIPATMWWAVATLTTVGYGDMYPVTAAGRFCAGLIAVLGIGMFALPTGILGAGFVEAIQKSKQPHERCPHCGKEL